MKKRANGDGSIYYDNARKKYVCSIVDESGKRVTKRFNTEREAKDCLSLLKASMLNDTYVAPNQITVGQWLTDYLELYVFPNITYSTRNTYINAISYAAPISDIPLQKLNPIILQGFINNLATRLHSNSVVLICGLFRRALTKAVHAKLVNDNAMLSVQTPKYIKPQTETFTIEEIKKLFDYLQGEKTKRREYTLFKTLFCTGARIGEILALQTTDVHDGYISITKSTKYEYGVVVTGATKTKHSRNVTVPKEITSLLRSLTPNDKGFIFHNVQNDHLMCSRNAYYLWKCVLDKLNIPYRNIHVLRHTHASYLLSKGIPITDVSQRLGHTNISTTLNFYAHALQDKEYQTNIARKINQLTDI